MNPIREFIVEYANKSEENRLHAIKCANETHVEQLLAIGGKTGDISDGYHTFDELYAHRIALYRLVSCLIEDYEGRKCVWKSEFHSDGTKIDGWFIAGIGMDKGKQITYHIPISEIKAWPGEILERAPEFDGHTSADVLKRLAEL